jgi:SAM-dependent methyltransferase
VWWGDGEYELVAERFAGIHDRLIERLGPRPGERFLDVGTGTGEVALRAAAAGAAVTAVDLAPGMVEKARSRSADVDWGVADAAALPFGGETFDVVASCFAVIFAPDPPRAAAELTRVARRRIGLTTWAPDSGLDALWNPYVQRPIWAEAWSTEEGLRGLLPAFDLELEEGTWWLEAESPEALWEWMCRAVPPHREGLRQLDKSQRQGLRKRFVELHRRYMDGGVLRYPRPYLLVTGTKR